MIDGVTAPISRVSGEPRFVGLRLASGTLSTADVDKGSRGSREAPRCIDFCRDACKNEYRIRASTLPATPDSMETC